MVQRAGGCSCVHACSRTRARRWAELWNLLACQEEYEEHVADVPELQIMEEILKVAAKDTLQERFSESIFEQTVDHPGDQACRVPTDTIHRQGCCRYACGDATTGPSDSDWVEDRGSPPGAVRRQSCGDACDHADVPVPHVAPKDTLQERISERTQIVDPHRSRPLTSCESNSRRSSVVHCTTEQLRDGVARDDFFLQSTVPLHGDVLNTMKEKREREGVFSIFPL